jgi:hypothetical protein
MPVITHTVRAVWLYPFMVKVWDKTKNFINLGELKKLI